MQRLLENRSRNLRMAYEQTYTFEVFYIQSGTISATLNTHSSFCPPFSYVPTSIYSSSVSSLLSQESPSTSTNSSELPIIAASVCRKCYFFGPGLHPQTTCPSRNVTCHTYGKLGHFAKVC